MTELKAIPVRIPESLDIELLINSNPVRDFKVSTDKIKFIIDYIVYRLNWNRRDFEEIKDRYVQLYSQAIKKYITRPC